MNKRLSAVIRGHVQGVGYRVFARDAALRLGVSGYVRNMPDGTVYVCAEGEEQKLRELVRDLERGPWGARVDSVQCEWSPATPTLPRHSFEVRA